MERGSEREHGQNHHLHHQQRPWSCSSFSMAAGFSWPPQRSPSSSSYTCGYCRREFRSAQALGGHMNVHRRERARLRQCPNPNPCPGGRAHPLPILHLSPPSTQQQQYYCPGDRPAIVYSFFSTTTTTAAAAASATKALEVDLELGVGVSRDGGMEEGLDLELRLGFS